ncbi:hypothetical protein Clo1100_1342 [Clostridium sp. BNL1100]|nr:hypothetical protein Clo1100_1342 [Clostridium sp. BNL1100]
MRHTIFWTLVLICFIISIILLVVYDVSLVKKVLINILGPKKNFLLFFLLEYLQLFVSTYISN